jgi:DNA-binding MarR family transcriptional regulator
MTAAVLDVLDVLTNASLDDPPWGLRICEQTGLGTSTIYPVLDRLRKAGWIIARWENPPPQDRPRRRYYELTATGRQEYAAALRAHNERRTSWLRPSPGTGSTS